MIATNTVITIDGPAGVGKSSVASYLAKEFNLLLLKSGSFYRALSLGLKEHLHNLLLECLENIYRDGDQEWQKLWQAIQMLQIYQDGEQILLNGRDVTASLQTRELDILSPAISKLPLVRHFINDLLRRQATNRSLIAEGRDMGSVVFPHARYKFFLDASVAVRAHRRYHQLTEQQPSQRPNIAELEQQIEARDHIDRNKKEGSLKPAENAHIIDTSRLTLGEVCQIIARGLT